MKFSNIKGLRRCSVDRCSLGWRTKPSAREFPLAKEEAELLATASRYLNNPPGGLCGERWLLWVTRVNTAGWHPVSVWDLTFSGMLQLLGWARES